LGASPFLLFPSLTHSFSSPLFQEPFPSFFLKVRPPKIQLGDEVDAGSYRSEICRRAKEVI